MWVRSLGWKDPLEEENSNPLLYSCLENLMDKGAWWATVLGVTKSRMRPRTHKQTHTDTGLRLRPNTADLTSQPSAPVASSHYYT